MEINEDKYSESKYKAVGVKLLSLLSEVLEIERENKKEGKEGNNFLSKRTFRKFLTEKYRDINGNPSSESVSLSNNSDNKQDACTTEVISNKQDACTTEYDPNFVGREGAIAHHMDIYDFMSRNSETINLDDLNSDDKQILLQL